MPLPSLAPLTPRDARVAELLRRFFLADVVMVTAAALIGMLARGLVQAYCHGTDVLELGAAGTGYCSTVEGAWSWTAFVVAAVAIAGVVRLACGRRRFARSVALATAFVAVIANTIIVYSLSLVLG